MGNLNVVPEATNNLFLPSHVRLVTGPGVWMESDATEQLARVAALPGCVRAAGMPDLHPGRGFPVGAAFAFAGIVHPHLIGGDAGCGARAVVTSVRAPALDALERRAGDALAEPVVADCDPEALLRAVWSDGPRALADFDVLPEALRELAASEPAAGEDGLPASGDVSRYLDAGFAGALGTIGGGNHFAEISRVESVAERGRMARGAIVVLVHSGSRGLGGALARHWGAGALDEEAAIATFLGELAGACRYARANRFLLAWKLLRALGAARPGRLAGGFEVIHNDVRREIVDGAPAWVHRKGAAPAYTGALTVVLGSRGAPSWVLEGLGEASALSSVAHGAGRRMGRSEARDKLKHRYRRAELVRTKLGSRVVCDDTDLLYEEHPDAYKPIEPVVASLIDAGLAMPVASLSPVVTVKR